MRERIRASVLLPLVADQAPANAPHSRHAVASACRRYHGDFGAAAACAGEGREKGERAEPASASGPKARRWPAKRPALFSFLFLKLFFKYFSNAFLSIQKTFLEFAPKINVSLNKILYNFTLRCN